MPTHGKSIAFARIRAEVIRLVAWIPPGLFTTCGGIAIYMNVIARHVATVLARLTQGSRQRRARRVGVHGNDMLETPKPAHFSS